MNKRCFFQDYQCSTDDLIEICELGRGAYGVVEKMRHKQTNIEMAVKVGLLTLLIQLYSFNFKKSKQFIYKSLPLSANQTYCKHN